MAIINVEDAYILDETGAEVDKVTGLFTKDENTTDAEKAFAQLNIGGGGGGWNLLDNPFFTIRQRGNGPFSSGYTADRWGIFGGVVTVTLSGSGFSVSASVGYNIQQRLPADLASFLNGKVVTLSCIVDGVLYSATGTLDTSGGYQLINTFGNDRFAFVGGANPAVIFTHTTASATHSYTVSAVKLELGSVSTIANDTPPKFWSEWAECRRYFKRFKAYSAVLAAIGVCTNTTNAQFVFGDEPMAKDTVTATYSGNLTIQSGDGSTHAISAVSASTLTGGGVVVSITSSGLVAGDSARLRINTLESYLDLSADL